MGQNKYELYLPRLMHTALREFRPYNDWTSRTVRGALVRGTLVKQAVGKLFRVCRQLVALQGGTLQAPSPLDAHWVDFKHEGVGRAYVFTAECTSRAEFIAQGVSDVTPVFCLSSGGAQHLLREEELRESQRSATGVIQKAYRTRKRKQMDRARTSSAVNLQRMWRAHHSSRTGTRTADDADLNNPYTGRYDHARDGVGDDATGCYCCNEFPFKVDRHTHMMLRECDWARVTRVVGLIPLKVIIINDSVA